MYGALDISTSALTAYRTQMDVIAGNIAMRESWSEENGEMVPYRRRVALFAQGGAREGSPNGVHVTSVVEDPAPFGLRWDPHSLFAYKEGKNTGYVPVSNVSYQTEMVNAMTALRAYEANVTVIEMTKSIASSTLRLIA